MVAETMSRFRSNLAAVSAVTVMLSASIACAQGPVRVEKPRGSATEGYAKTADVRDEEFMRSGANVAQPVGVSEMCLRALAPAKDVGDADFISAFRIFNEYPPVTNKKQPVDVDLESVTTDTPNVLVCPENTSAFSFVVLNDGCCRMGVTCQSIRWPHGECLKAISLFTSTRHMRLPTKRGNPLTYLHWLSIAMASHINLCRALPHGTNMRGPSELETSSMKVEDT